MTFQEKKDLYRVRKNVLDMIQDRGFSIPPELLSLNFEQFSMQFDQENIDMFIENEDKGKFYIHFCLDKSFGKNDLKALVQKIITNYDDSNIKIVVLLKDKEKTSIIKEKNKPLYKNVEFFEQKVMTFKIMDHIYQPKFIILSESEVEELIEKYKTPISKFPTMSVNDPVAKYYGVKKGQVFKILRIDPEVGFGIGYRVVV